ncbi:MAG TPA: hypothetical protein VFX96_18500 [Pyrinomonadaceae bacterium]|nr:hypothetical protein [Pyrinomonadaceae bacterium]
MTKWLIVLGVLLLLGGLVYWRLRPYINLVRRFFGAVREARRVGEQRQARGASDMPGREPRRVGGRLARCPVCGTWFPPERAVTFRGDPAKYCSHSCLERAAERPRRTGTLRD